MSLSMLPANQKYSSRLYPLPNIRRVLSSVAELKLKNILLDALRPVWFSVGVEAARGEEGIMIVCGEGVPVLLVAHELVTNFRGSVAAIVGKVK